VFFIRLIMLLASAFLIGSGIIYIVASKEALFSFIVAFITSSIVVLSSFKSYKNMVQKRLELNPKAEEFDNRDTIDKLEDPYNLYDEEIEQNQEELNIKELIKQEKKLLKKNRRSFKDTFKDSAKAFNPIRLIAYAILVFGYFYLLKSNNLSIIFYLATLIVPNIIIIIYLLNFKQEA